MILLFYSINKISQRSQKLLESEYKVSYKVRGEVSGGGWLCLPPLNSLLGRLADDVGPPVLGHHAPVFLDDDQHGDALHSILLLQVVGEGGVVLHSAPVSVRLLHVGDHVIRRPVAGDKHDLQVVRDLPVEVTEHGSELPAGRTPVGREVVEDEILHSEVKVCSELKSLSHLVLQSFLCLNLAAVSLQKSCSFKGIHCFHLQCTYSSDKKGGGSCWVSAWFGKCILL